MHFNRNVCFNEGLFEKLLKQREIVPRNIGKPTKITELIVLNLAPKPFFLKTLHSLING